MCRIREATGQALQSFLHEARRFRRRYPTNSVRQLALNWCPGTARQSLLTLAQLESSFWQYIVGELVSISPCPRPRRPTETNEKTHETRQAETDLCHRSKGPSESRRCSSSTMGSRILRYEIFILSPRGLGRNTRFTLGKPPLL